MNLVVREKRKAEWDRAVEEGEYESLADLVRTAVDKELHGGYDSPAEGGGSAPQETEARLSEDVLNRLARIEDSLSEVGDTVKRVEQNTSKGSPDYNTKKVLLALIPETDYPDEGVTAGWLSNKTDLPLSKVEDLLEELEKEYPDLEMLEFEGENRWFKLEAES